MAAVTHLGGPARAASDEPVKRPGLPLERQNDVETSAGLQHPRDLTKNSLRVIDVLQHIEDPDEVKFRVAKRELLGSGKTELHSARFGFGDRKRRLTQVASKGLQVRSPALDGLRHRAGSAAHIEDPARERGELVQEVAQLQPVHEPGPRAKLACAPALGLVIERFCGLDQAVAASAANCSCNLATSNTERS